MAIATLAELRSFVGIPVADVTDDALLTIALDASLGLVASYTGRDFDLDAGTSVRFYTADSVSSVTVDQFQTTTGLAVALDYGDGTFGTAWVLDTDFRLAPFNAAAQGRPWSMLATTAGRSFPIGKRAVRVTARFGWTTAPATVKQAVLLQASRLFVRRQAPFGVAGSPELGSEVRLLARLDPDVELLLRPYRRHWIVTA